MGRAQVAAANHKIELEKLLSLSLVLEKRRVISIPPGILLPFSWELMFLHLEPFLYQNKTFLPICKSFWASCQINSISQNIRDVLQGAENSYSEEQGAQEKAKLLRCLQKPWRSWGGMLTAGIDIIIDFHFWAAPFRHCLRWLTL